MDNKVYRLLFPQMPLVRTQNYNNFDFGQCPSGTNAVVAVISYTGYDMHMTEGLLMDVCTSLT